MARWNLDAVRTRDSYSSADVADDAEFIVT
jgi:hypothetical protein